MRGPGAVVMLLFASRGYLPGPVYDQNMYQVVGCLFLYRRKVTKENRGGMQQASSYPSLHSVISLIYRISGKIQNNSDVDPRDHLNYSGTSPIVRIVSSVRSE